MAASRHTTDVTLSDFSPNGLLTIAGLEYHVEFRLSKAVSFLSSFMGNELPITGARKKGFQCHFKSDNGWLPNITHWDQPFEPVGKWVPRDSVKLSKEIHMQLSANMLTTTGFASVGLGGEAFETEARQALDGKLYLGVSGGGWRSFTGNMGIFRVLSKRNILGLVHMVSSVSGGSWFLAKIAFDAVFSANVLLDRQHITEVALSWMESEYFPQMRDPTPLAQDEVNKTNSEAIEACFLSTMVTQSAEPIKNALGLNSAIVAAKHFSFSWQNLVEHAVLGENVPYDQPLASSTLAPTARSRFGNNITLSFNWNMLHQWDQANKSTCTKWYLQETGGQHAQPCVHQRRVQTD